ncbi:hypothetical protein [Hyphomonas sp.]|uniref:hypothetical protein n=1 Tax=Hyphomonas sp. TaxID=87 RepID=UPI0035283643
MTFLIALAAFVAIISVYSTIVTVIVEGIHKVFGLRSSGMNEMLRAFYDETLPGLQPPNTPENEKVASGDRSSGPSKGAKHFADSISSAPTARSTKFWYVRRWPLIGRMFSARRKSMTALDFVESLAETPEGSALRHYSREDLRHALHAAAYEFERLGDIQKGYFNSRASIISVLVGMMVAVFINFDAIAVYKELSANAALSSRMTLLLDQERVDLMRRVASDGEGAAGALGLDGEDWAALVGDTRSLGIPVGRKMFPHCEGYKYTDGTRPEKSPTEFADVLSNEAYYDNRCGKSRQEQVNRTWATSFEDYLIAAGDENSSGLERWGHWLKFETSRIAVILRNPQTFLLWLAGVLVAGGLMGLGAPFWFKLFSRFSSIAMPMQRSASLAFDPGAPVQKEMAESSVGGVRPTGSSNLDDLERGFVTVLSARSGDGVSLHPAFGEAGAPGGPPPGRQIGSRPAPPGRIIRS